MTNSSNNDQPQESTQKRFDWRPIRKQAKPILKALGEKGDQPRNMVERMIRRCGVEFVQELVEEALQIEAQGGMMTNDGSRRRTPGGVFFKLAKGRVPSKHWYYVFAKPSYGKGKKSSEKTAAESAPDQPESQEQPEPKKQAKPPKQQQQPERQEQPESPEVARLRQQAEELRQKIAEREEAGGAGVKMLRKMLEKVEAQLG